MENCKCVDLAEMAKERGRAEKATVGLGTLVETELAEHLAKDDRIRRSQWSNANLTEEQREYAALDAIKGHEIYDVLKQHPDLTERLDSRLAIPGALVDILPSHGVKSGAVPTGATGVILDTFGVKHWNPPEIFRTKQMKTEGRRLVKVTKTFAAHLAIPHLQFDGRAACLDDFNHDPDDTFTVLLPLKMLREARGDTEPEAPPPHIERTIDPADNETASSYGADTCGARRVDVEDLDGSEFSDLQMRLIESARNSGVTGYCELLTSEGIRRLCLPPRVIIDRYSPVMGDSFHFMDRPKVPMHHEFKKSYFFSLQQAWFAWDDKKLDEVLKALREEDGLTQDEALAKMHFNAAFFLD